MGDFLLFFLKGCLGLLKDFFHMGRLFPLPLTGLDGLNKGPVRPLFVRFGGKEASVKGKWLLRKSPSPKGDGRVFRPVFISIPLFWPPWKRVLGKVSCARSLVQALLSPGKISLKLSGWVPPLHSPSLPGGAPPLFQESSREVILLGVTLNRGLPPCWAFFPKKKATRAGAFLFKFFPHFFFLGEKIPGVSNQPPFFP